MKKFILASLFLICFLCFTHAYGSNVFKNVISMENDQYKAHYKKIVVFPHLSHTNQFGISCGECHHDDNGDPLEDLVIGDDVDRCIECHSTPSYVTGKSYEEQLEYHTNVLHFKCKDCHRKKNNEQESESFIKKRAPIKCNQCH